MSSFDPATFLDATMSEPLVKRPPIPAEDYTGVLGEVVSRAWTGKADPTKSGIALDIPITIEIPAAVQAQLGITTSTITLKDSIMLDLTPQGSIDLSPGKNRRLRMYREAVDLNKVGDSFSPRAMQGKVVLVKVSHELYNEEIQERVAAVAKLG